MTPEEQQHRIVSVNHDAVREQDKIHLVLAYLGLLALIPLLTVKDSSFVRWHAKQGLVLCLAFILVSTLLNIIPGLGQLLWCGLVISNLVVVIVAISKALKGERWSIPLIADLAAKL